MSNQAEKEVRMVRLFEFKPGRIRRAWLCVPCIEPSYRAGKFHAPVHVPAVDLDGEVCLICKKPVA